MDNKRTGQDFLDFKKGMEALKRKKKGKHSNKSTQDLINKLKESGDW